MTILVEAAVESVDAALAAAEGGAHRIELCTDLAHGGTTPDVPLLRACRARLSIPVFVLIRPRAGDFAYTDAEHRTTLEQIRQAKDTGAHGIVTGALTTSREIAGEHTAALIAAARPLPVTFHRAFDVCANLSAALESLIRLGVERVLTSGGAPTAPEGAGRIARLVAQASGRIAILAGGGIDEQNVARLVRESGVREVHFSVKDAEKVRRVRRFLAALAVVLIATSSPATAQNAVVTRNVNLRAGPSSTTTFKETLHPPDELTILDTVWARNVQVTDTVAGAVPPPDTGGPPTVFHGCSLEGSATQANRQASNRKKNRLTRPQAGDIDGTAALTAIHQTGDDRTRWSDTRGASIVAYVIEVKKGSQETVNCGDTDSAYIDTHIDVVQHPTDSAKRTHLIVEVTPRWREFVSHQGTDWTTRTVKQTLEGHWVRFTGWLFWDFEHAHNAENTNPGVSSNWRATAWEVHPVTQIKICPGTPQSCD